MKTSLEVFQLTDVVDFFQGLNQIMKKKNGERTTKSKLRKVDTLLIHAIGMVPTTRLGQRFFLCNLASEFLIALLM